MDCKVISMRDNDKSVVDAVDDKIGRITVMALCSITKRIITCRLRGVREDEA